MFQKLTDTSYVVSAWSGGTTTQLAIYPENAVYADRDFLWRVSSATVDLEDSDFTPLPDYDRLIATLEGEIVLTHNGGAPLRLRPPRHPHRPPPPPRPLPLPLTRPANKRNPTGLHSFWHTQAGW